MLYGDAQEIYFSQTVFSPRPTIEKNNSPLPGEEEKIRNQSDEGPSFSATTDRPMAKNKKRLVAVVALVCTIAAGLLTAGRSYLQKAPLDHWSTPVTMSVSVMEPSDEAAKFAAHVLESQLHENCPHIQLLERTDWQLLKQEYDIMSSRLVPRRNRITPELLTAALFLIIDVNRASNPPTLLMRLAETGTGSIKHNFNEPLDSRLFTEQKKRLCETVVATLEKEYPLKGRIVKSDSRKIILNVGYDHGVRPGQRFEVVENGEILKIETSDDIKARTSAARQEQPGNASLEDNLRVRRIFP